MAGHAQIGERPNWMGILIGTLIDRQEQPRRRQAPWVRGRPEFTRHPVRHFAFHLLRWICLHASPL